MGFRNPILRLSQLIADTITGATINGGTINAADINVGSNITIDPTNGIEIHYTDPTTGQPAVLQIPANGAALVLPGNLLDPTTQANIQKGVSALATADGKNTAYFTPAAPAPPAGGFTIGDLWFNISNNNAMSTWNGSGWGLTQFGTNAIAPAVIGTITTAQTTATNAGSAASAAQASANAAQTAANTAQSTANGKNTVSYVTVAPTAATPGFPGDTQFLLSGGQITAQYQCTAGTGGGSGNTWVIVQITNTVIANLDAGKLTSGYISASVIAAGLITTAMLAANSVTATQLAAGAISAGSAVIANGAISDAQIANLDAGKITTGTLSALAVSGCTITGGTFQTATSGQRWVINSVANTNKIIGYTGNAAETTAGNIQITNGTVGVLALFGPAFTGATNQASLELSTNSSSSGQTEFAGAGDLVSLTGGQGALSIDATTGIVAQGYTASLIGGLSAHQGTVKIDSNGTPTVRAASTSPTDVWTALPYASGWADEGGGFVGGQYRLDVLGWVHLRGLVKATANQAVGATIATLPAGFVPGADESFLAAADSGGTRFAENVYVETDGTIRIQGTAITSGGFISLSGISFQIPGV